MNDTDARGSHFGFGYNGGPRGCAVTPDTAWHHYAAVAVSGQIDPVLYIDGVPQSVTLRNGTATLALSSTTRPLHMGAFVDTQSGWLNYSDTMIDEPAVYDRALTAAEIQAIYNAGSAGKCPSSQTNCVSPPSGLVSWWAGEGNTLDYVGGNNGTLQGSVTFVPGQVGQAFGLNGTNAYVNIASSPALKPTGPFSVEGWANYDGFTGNAGTIAAKGQDVENAIDWALVIDATQKLRPLLNVGGSWVAFNCASTLATGVWYHVAMVYDGSNLRGYVNGLQDGAVSASGTVQTTDYPFRIGAYAPINGIGSKAYLAGRVDEVSVYNRALTASEIHAIYSAGGGGKCGSQAAPAITTQPANQTVVAGSNPAFSVTVTGTPTLAYQWLFGGTNIAGATGTSLTLTNVQSAQSGDYAVVVTNTLGAITSAVATLTVVSTAPIMASQPLSASVFPGFPAQLTAAATGTEPLSYQWQFSSTDLPEATNAQLAIATIGS